MHFRRNGCQHIEPSTSAFEIKTVASRQYLSTGRPQLFENVWLKPKLQSFLLLNIQEILVGVHGQFAAGGFVAGDDRAVVHLQGGAGPLLAYAAFHCGGQGAGFVMAVDQDQHFLGIRHSANAHGKGLAGHGFGIVAEEAAVHDAGVRGQVPNARAGRKAGEGLVEGDVAVHADAAHEQVDAAVGSDLCLIAGAFPFGIVGHAVEDIDILRLHVYQMVKEIVVHEVPVALVMLVGQAQVLVHVEGDHVGEGQFPRLVHPRQFLVHADGGGTGGQAQYEGAVFLVRLDLPGDVAGGPQTHFLIVFLNYYAHIYPLSAAFAAYYDPVL